MYLNIRFFTACLNITRIMNDFKNQLIKCFKKTYTVVVYLDALKNRFKGRFEQAIR